MADINEKVNIEMTNISKILLELKKVKDRPNKELVVLAGIGSFLKDVYMGIENILKQILKYINISIPKSDSWHKDLIKLSADKKIVTQSTGDKIGKYLVFRHFYLHSYDFILEENELNPLVEEASKVFAQFEKEIKRYLKDLKS